MIQIFLLISTLGILFVVKYLLWFLDDNYDIEEKIIRNIIARSKCSAVIDYDKPESDYWEIKSSKTTKVKYIKDSGIQFYSFNDDSTESNSDNSNNHLSNKCA